MRRMLALILGLAVAAVSSAAARAATPAGDPVTAAQVLDLAGVGPGLCVHIGCGREGSEALTAELAARSGMIVHGLALDEASLERARKAVAAKGLSGRVMVEKLPINPLPYLNDLADLIVLEDAAALARQGVTAAELSRVLAPGGALLVQKDRVWMKTVKPRPQEMDDWTHPNHGADGNMVSQDRLVGFPLGLRWIDGLPMNVNRWAACRAWVAAQGRLFLLTTNVPENLGPEPDKPQYLCAHNAWNGLPLWKVNCQTTDDGASLNWINAGSLVTDGRRVYAGQKDKVVGFDAASGTTAVTFPTRFPAARLVLADGVLVASCWEARTASKAFSDAESVWSTWVAKGDAGTVAAYDAQSGAPKWSFPFPAQQVIAADGVAYLLMQKGNPPTERWIVAVELATGKERWRVPHTRFGAETDLQLNTAGKGYVVIAKRGDAQGLGAPKLAPDARPRLRAVFVLSAADGKTLWQISPAKSYWTPVVDGQLWYQSRKYDPLSGEEKGSIGWSLGDQFCTPQTIVNNYLLRTRGGQYVRLPENGNPAKDLRYGGARGACIEGMVPANGMFYTAQNNCQCQPGQVYGFVAVGPCGSLPATAEFEKPRPLEKGPAFAKEPPEPATGENDWPTYRGNAERTASTSCSLPGRLKELWQAPVTEPPRGPLAEAWKARLASCLTAPVSAGGRVFVAASDAGQIIALDARTGKPQWKATLGGRVDTPPTIYKGLCLVGTHDGWVYALRAKDGQLAWRTRVAPQERRMVAYGQVESVWPTVGTVLVHDGVAYACAGRTSESDGGIAVVALDPVTGKHVWGKSIAQGPQRMNDLLAVRNGQIAWYNVRLDAKTGQAMPGATFPKDPSQGGMLDGTWTLFKFRRSGNGFAAGKVVANILAWNEKSIVSPTTATARDSEEKLWAASFARAQQVEAIALASNAAALAGRTADSQGKPAGFLAVLAAANGQKLSGIPLASPPTYDGLAIAQQRVFISLQDGRLVCFGKAE